MADQKISQLTDAGAVTGNEEIPIALAGANYRLSASELKAYAVADLEIGSDVQAYSANLTTWSGVAPSANGQSLVSAANYAAMRALLDLEAGTDFYSKTAADAAFQPLDSDLTAIAALSTTAFGRGLLALADAAALRTSAGLGTAATQNTGTSGANLPFLNGTNTWANAQTFSANLTVTDTNGRARLSPTGDASFYRSGGTTAAIYLNSGLTQYIYNTSSQFQFVGAGLSVAGTLTPSTNNTYSFGNASFRWTEVFATNGTINTSDAREKTPLREIPNTVKAAAAKIAKSIGIYQWLASVEKKGDAARLHAGITAQSVRDAFLEQGEDPERWGVFCKDLIVEQVYNENGEPTDEYIPVLENGEPKYRLGVRYDQLNMLIMAVIAEKVL